MIDLLDELYKAYRDARKNKRNTRSQLQFELNLEANLYKLAHELHTLTYKVGPSSCFIVTKPVQREIFAADFRDRVVHHLVARRINPVIEPHLIHDSYSCRKSKGTLFGVHRLDYHLKSCTANFTQSAWVLKLDIQGYFMNIPRDALYRSVMRMVKPTDLLTKSLLRQIIFTDPTKNCVVKGSTADWIGLPKSKSLFHTPTECGLPIGNLTSQLFSNVYLNPLDHFVKRTLGVRHYGRYVDDFFLVDQSKKRLIAACRQIEVFVREELKLTLHPNKRYLQPVAHGVDFLGVRIKNGALLPGRCICRNALETMRVRAHHRADLPRVNAYLGVLRPMHSYDLRRKIVRLIQPPLAPSLRLKPPFLSIKYRVT